MDSHFGMANVDEGVYSKNNKYQHAFIIYMYGINMMMMMNNHKPFLFFDFQLFLLSRFNSSFRPFNEIVAFISINFSNIKCCFNLECCSCVFCNQIIPASKNKKERKFIAFPNAHMKKTSGKRRRENGNWRRRTVPMDIADGSRRTQSIWFHFTPLGTILN